MHENVYSKRGSRKARLAVAGVALCLTATVAACSSASSSASSASSAKGDSAGALSPSQAVLLAAQSASAVNTFSGTISVQGTYNESGTSGNINMSGTMSGQLHPSVLLSADIGTLSAAGENLGPMDEVLTTSDLYLKMGMLSQLLHSSKPWVEMSLSALSGKSGVNLGSLLSQAQDSSPLTQSQLLAGATDVKELGTSTIAGVPVTEYSGTISMSKAIAAMPASSRSAVQQEIATTGIKSASFKAWLDSQHQVKKETIVEDGTTVSETTTVTMTSVNQPVTITPPAASQVTSIPASALSGA